MDKKALYKITYGLYIVASRQGDKVNGQIANSVFQVTSDPPRVAVALNRENLTHDMVMESGVFSVSVLGQNTPFKFIGLFGFRSGREVDKFSSVNYEVGQTGAPLVLDHTIAWMEFETERWLEVETHTIFIGILKGGKVLQEGPPLTYEYYHRVLKGKVPKTATTYIKEE